MERQSQAQRNGERERGLPGHLGPEELEMMKSNSFLKPRFESEANMRVC